MTDQYATIAGLYDEMAAAPGLQAFYREWRQSLREAARRHRVVIRTLVDLACGTGNTTIPWARRRGWTVVGVDSSSAMLDEARRKSSAVRWYCQDLTRLRLAERADAVTCHGDALNHILDARRLQRAFVNVAAILRDGGLFLFDLNTADVMRWLDGREKMCRAGRHVFVAANRFDPKRGIATFRHTWFVATGRLFEKRDVTVRERAYDEADVRRMLHAAGFRVASVKVQREVEGKAARLLYTAIGGQAPAGRRPDARHQSCGVIPRARISATCQTRRSVA
jgi:SAM-dependent methyltransferase